MTTEMIELVRRDPEEVWTEGSVGVIDEIFAESFVLHYPSSPAEPRDREEYREYVETFRSAFTDLTYAVDDVIADGDTAALRYTATGTHDGELLGVEPTGERVSVPGMEMYRVENGEIVEMWTSYDALGLFRQLGVLPPLEELSELAERG
ncbi:ester cyclase [Natrononativus amylolyticus]|uniref:ester cyclase n=1 Tax=Natrononativus amylolyticus TaxID=2963434 RepID=UPI0020CEA684|nr:ester cyclase [Natrononativus amylolyticus]